MVTVVICPPQSQLLIKIHVSSVIGHKYSTEGVNSSVARFARKFLWKFPRPVGHTYSCCATRHEENCKMNLNKNKKERSFKTFGDNAS